MKRNKTLATGALSSINGAARLINEASPTPTSLEKKKKRTSVHHKTAYYWHMQKPLFPYQKTEKDRYCTYMRQIVMVQKLNEKPHPTTATVQTDNPTPISLNGLTLQIFIHA